MQSSRRYHPKVQPVSSNRASNVYVAIQEEPQVSLDRELKAMDEIRKLEKTIREKKKLVKEARKERVKATEQLAYTFDQKNKLKRAAKEILTLQMFKDLHLEEPGDSASAPAFNTVEVGYPQTLMVSSPETRSKEELLTSPLVPKLQPVKPDGSTGNSSL